MNDVELGWSLPRRLQYFEEQKSSSPGPYRLEFTGTMMTFPIIRVPNGLPRYRLLNGRTASLQREWLAEHPGEGTDFFSADPEREAVQREQHKLLLRLVRGAGLQDYFRDPSHKQTEPLILDSHGFVINGNRRLCCWRELYAADNSKYNHYSHVDVVMLPPADDAAIDKLEAQLQIVPDIRDEYTWDAKANMMYDRQELHKLTVRQLAELYNMEESKIRRLMQSNI